MSRTTEIMDAGNALAWWTSSTMGPVRSATCGMFAGAALVAVEHPLQTVRQNASPPTATSNVASRASTWVSAKNMVKAQGIRAVYRGASSPLVRYSCTHPERMENNIHVFSPDKYITVSM